MRMESMCVGQGCFWTDYWAETIASGAVGGPCCEKSQHSIQVSALLRSASPGNEEASHDVRGFSWLYRRGLVLQCVGVGQRSGNRSRCAGGLRHCG